MILFLYRGLFRDKQRSKLPVIIVSLGVMLTVLLSCWVEGVVSNGIDMNARFSTGHVKVMSGPYADHEEQVPNDLALMDVSGLVDELKEIYPDMHWVERIRLGGLLDVPDELGETKSQGPVSGIAIDLFNDNQGELERLNISRSLVKGGRIPELPGEVLLSDSFAVKMGVSPGDNITIISSTMHGGMAFYNLTLVGTVNFGSAYLDRGTIIVDISDARLILDMHDAAGEILGYFDDGYYNDKLAVAISSTFNKRHAGSDDEFAPVMVALSGRQYLGQMLSMAKNMGAIVSTVFIVIMSIVLWNAGILGGLRRYGEFGLRLAVGEGRGHIYGSLVGESVIVGVTGSILGTFAGLLLAWWLQSYGIDFSKVMKNVSMMIPTVYRARITPEAFYIGLVPGMLSTVMGAMLSGIGIYRRGTAGLFKELEN